MAPVPSHCILVTSDDAGGLLFLIVYISGFLVILIF